LHLAASSITDNIPRIVVVSSLDGQRFLVEVPSL
jgi:hypothetical protein